MLDNLLSNVRAHTPRGTSATVVVGREGDQAVWRVEDDGPGIPPEHAGQLFERFYRADTSRSRAAIDGRYPPGDTSGAGAGFGLSIVSALVTAHGGTISVGERPGGGASSTARLPLSPA